MLTLQNKTAIVTGAGRGIGKAIALAYAEAGANVALVARTRPQLEQVAAQITAAGRRALVIAADVTDPAGVAGMVNATLAEFGTIDILVNNAGMARSQPVLEMSLDDWNRTMTTNLTSVFLCSQAVCRHMIERRQGKIINISSGSGVRGSPGNAVYSASKAGVIAFTEALAGEVRQFGVQVNVICPGPVNTEMLAQRPHNETPAQNVTALEPAEIAGLALYLASDSSGRISAQRFLARVTNRW